MKMRIGDGAADRKPCSESGGRARGAAAANLDETALPLFNTSGNEALRFAAPDGMATTDVAHKNTPPPQSLRQG